LLSFIATTPALAHFVYLVPSDNQSEVQVVFSETPIPDEKVAVDKILTTKLLAIDKAGKETPLPWTRTSDHFLTAKLPTPAPAVVTGVTDYGVTNSRHTGNIPVLINYYSQVILGDLRSTPARPTPAVIEIVPTIRENRLTFRALAQGKPLAESDCVVKTPGNEKGERSKTNTDGSLLGQFDQPGRYGVWVRLVDLSPGEVNGTPYDKVHSYATLVVDYPGAK
jgi:hypothetical protein